MSDAKQALPHPIANDAVQALLNSKKLPEAVSIAPLKVTAAYHGLYLINLPEISSQVAERLEHHELILRVSGRHLPVMKTENEVGIMTWVRRNTAIPIPDLIAWDASEENPIGHEYTLLARAPGVPLSDVYNSLTEAQHGRILHQLIDHLVELHSFPWDGIGGLALEDGSTERNVVLSRVVDEDFWQSLDVAQFWGPSGTIENLNLKGPYRTYLDLVSARIQKSAELIGRHDALAFMRDILPRLDSLLSLLASRMADPDDPDQLNRVNIRLAHRDLHFANILIDPATAEISAVLDWEFAGVVPFIEWNPRRAFLWNAKEGPESLEEKQRWMKRFEECCRERGVAYLLEDVQFSSPLQENLHKIHNYLRAIVEVSPRGQRRELVQEWKDTVLENLARFGI
jgi:hypothetical protein